VPVPLTASALKNDDDMVPVQVLSYLGGAAAVGVKLPLSVQIF